MGAQVARLSHARVTVLGHGAAGGQTEGELQRVREWIGSGLAAVETVASPDRPAEAVAVEASRQHYDLVVQAMPARGRVELSERLLRAGDHNLLLVPGSGPVPSRALICVTVGEPAKEDVLFAGRLVRHLGAEATILTVLPDKGDAHAVRQAERFLAAGSRTLSLLGVEATSSIRYGPARQELLSEMRGKEHGLLVLGAPLVARRGRVSLNGVIGSLLDEVNDRPVLIVRPHYEEWWH